jgi:long-chain acyl-CoA synthetase
MDRLYQATRSHRHAICLEYFGRRLSYDHVWQCATQFADVLNGMGLTKGDRVFIVLPNVPEAVFAVLGTLMVGGVVVMSNPLLSRDEHAFQLKDCGAKIAVVLDALAPRFSAFFDEAKTEGSPEPVLRYILASHLGDAMPWRTRTLGRLSGKLPFRSLERLKGVVSFADALAVGRKELACTACTGKEPGVLIYTGGTTGKPKAVELTRENLNANISQIAAWLNFLPDGSTNVLGVFPLFSAAGLTALLLHTFVRGGTLSLIPRPSPETILEALQRLPIHVLPAVPTLFKGMLRDATFLRDGPRRMRHMKVCLSGAAPLSESVNAQWKQSFGSDVHELYGMTETTAMAFGNRPGTPIKHGSVGLPLPQLECRIVDLDEGDRVLGRNQVGEICLRGPQIFGRYFNNPEETDKALRSGWLHTGDVGSLDEDGYLFIRGRKKEMVLSSGYNVYPVEIEEALLKMPGVSECACIGVADDYREEAIKAFVVSEPGRPLSTGAIMAYCNEHLARYKVPREVALVAALPKNSLGKVLKQELR